MSIQQPPLPYAQNALEPHMSERTFQFHYGKHHATYVTNLNNLIADTDLAGKDLEDIIKAVAGDDGKKGVFNNAAQVWNHTFFWNCMKPGGGGTPSGDLAAKIDADLGGFDAFADTFKKTALGQFGSGWAWLVADGGRLAITSTANADLPMAHGQTALLTIDVWEHAYYLDHQNNRGGFVDTFLGNLVNWDFVAQNLADS